MRRGGRGAQGRDCRGGEEEPGQSPAEQDSPSETGLTQREQHPAEDHDGAEHSEPHGDDALHWLDQSWGTHA